MRSDCGCGKAVDEKAVGPTAATAAPATPDPVAGQKPVAAGPISQLNPRNGLFLKAEHLEGMQDYATALSRALGISVGTGVVYGFELELSEGKWLSATPGLAFNSIGQPLQTGTALRIPIVDQSLPGLDADGFWVVEAVPEVGYAGSENAYGAVCADPCEPTSAIQPWRLSLVRLRLRPDTLDGLEGKVGLARRSWLASAYFERERRRGHPWPVPGERLTGAPSTVGSLFSRNWTDAGSAADGIAVPLGVLTKVDGVVVLDTWTARRELTGSPGEHRWDGHLARRSWSIFLAQLLQFQDQLSTHQEALCGPPVAVGVDQSALAVVIKEYLDEMEPTPVAKWGIHRELVTRVAALEGGTGFVEQGPTLPELGFGELPPAGYLGCVDPERFVTRVIHLFAGTVDLRFCRMRADDVSGVVESARHRDRIPLSVSSDPRPLVDILVPTYPADLDGTRVDQGAYDWVAFVRGTPRDCEGGMPQSKAEEVDFAYVSMDVDTALKTLVDGDVPDGPKLDSVTYPAGADQLPADATKPTVLDEFDVVGVIGVALSSATQELAAKRADGVVQKWGLMNGSAPSKVASVSLPTLKLALMLLCVEPRPGGDQ